MFWNIIGHAWAVQLLRGHIQNQSLRHAYLITGPQGIGKKNLAVRFIQAIFCQKSSEPGSPCLSCHTCHRIQRLEHPDIFPVSIEQDSSQIKIDQIRDLVHNLSLSPYEAKNRIGLLLDLEFANINTLNALLKTLEEPPDPVILILTAVSTDALLETITSRCEEIKLQAVPVSTTSQGLINIHNIPEDQADFLAHISGGKPELALDYYRDSSLLDQRTDLLDQHIKILSTNSVERFAYAEKVSKKTQNIGELIEIWFSLWHDILIQAGNSGAPIRNIDRGDDIHKILKSIDLSTAKQTLELFRQAHALLRNNANQKLTLEDLLLQLPQMTL
jgi:DNA polymerase-3 subunit delta'